jgi:maltose-binding protein MalE
MDGVPMPNVKAMAVIFNYAAGMIDKFKSGEQSVENAVKTAVSTIIGELTDKQARYE